MELLDRYLNAVRAGLPKAQADDIVAEIADDLQSQIDEREDVLGRALTTDETADVLKAYGNPRVVAARYAKHQYLIGPALFPFYVYAMKLVLTIAIALELAGGLLGALALGSFELFYRSLDTVWHSFFLIVGIVTAIFALIERLPAGKSPLDRIGITKWDPRTLPAAGAETIPYVSSIFQVLANGLFALVLLDFAGFRHNLLATMGLPVQFAAFTAAWQPFYVVLVISSLALAFTGIVNILRSDWVKVRAAVLVAANALVIAGAALTLRSGQLFAPDSPTLARIGFWGLIACIVIAAITAVVYARPLLRKNRVAPDSGTSLDPASFGT